MPGTPIRDEAQMVSLVEGFGERLRLEFRRGHEAGMTDANDLGEIVDPATGEKRPLRQDEVSASTKAVEARWGVTGKA